MSLASFPQLCRADFFPLPDVPLSVFRMKDGPNHRHSHDFHELVFVAHGTARHELFPPSSDLGEGVQMAEGDLFLIPVGWSHRYDNCARFEIFNILFAPEFLEQWPYDDAIFGLCNDVIMSPVKWRLQLSERKYLETLLQTIMREFTGRLHGFKIAVTAKLAEALVWLNRLSNQPPEQRAPESQIAVAQAVAFMEQHFAESIVLDDIARAAHLSTHYFCEVFKNSTGLSPKRYLARLRLEHARYLLLTTPHSITKVAHDVGFADASYFTRAFKAAFGASPTRLRSAGI